MNEVIAHSFQVDVYHDVQFVTESLEQIIEAAHALIYQIKERNGIRWPIRTPTEVREVELVGSK